MIRTENLRKEYGRFVAVSQVDLEVQEGDVFALIGPNGAGKTTLLRMLTGLLEPTFGKVFIGNHEITANTREHFHQIGFMPDVYSLYEDLTVVEFLTYFANCYQLREPDKTERLETVIKLVNLETKYNDLVKGLSKGMKQRLLLAKTLLHDPDVLFLDEPAAGLDPKARLDLRQIIKNLQRMGKTLVVSSHILSELSDFCNAYGIMEKGQFVKTGRFEHFEDTLNEVQFRQVFIEVTHNESELLAFLNAYQGRVLKHEGLAVMFELEGDRGALVKLNQELIQAALPVVSFYEKRANIEDLFMQFSQHEVS